MQSHSMNQIFILLSIFIFSYATNVSALDEEACAYDGEMNSFVNSFFDSQCLDFEGEARCECLAKEKDSNQFLASMNPQANILLYQKEQRSKKTTHFFEVYNQMFLGSAIQRQILFGKDADKNQESQVQKVVGCTASEMSGKIEKKIKLHLDDKKDLEEEALALKKSEYNDCKVIRNNCEWLGDQVKALEEKIKLKKDDAYKIICAEMAENNEKTSTLMLLNTAKSWYLSSGLTDQEINKKTQHIDCLIIQTSGTAVVPEEYTKKGCEKITGPWSTLGNIAPSTKASFEYTMQPIKFEKLPENSDDIPNLPPRKITVTSMHQSCSLTSSGITKFLQDFDEEKINHLAKEGKLPQKENDLHLSDCGEDKICKSFDDINKKALHAKEQDFSYSPKNCISYPEFLIKKGIPGDDFMQALANTPEDKVGELLRAPTVLNSNVAKQRLDFLKSNPLVAQLVLDDKKRIQLAKELKKVSLTNAKKSKAEKLESYLSFIKGPVKELIQADDFKSSQKFLCEQMINNYTSIQISNELPPIKNGSEDFPLMAAVQSCKLSLDMITSVTDSVGVLEINDLFKEVENDVPELSDEEKFKKMNEENCKEYPEYAKSQCASVQNEDCRKKFLSSGSMKDEQKVFDTYGTRSQLSQEHISRAGAYSRDTDQDTVYKREWDKKIGSKLSRNVIPFKGQKEEFSKAQAEDKSRVAAGMPEFKQPDSSKVTPSQSTNNSITKTNIESNNQKTQSPNPGQILPSYPETPVTFLPEKLAASKDVRSSIPDFDKLPQEDKIEGLNQIKNYLDDSKDNFETTDLQRKIAETDKLLDAELKQQKENSNKYSAFNYKAPNFNSNTNQATEGNGVISPSGDNSGSSSAASGNIANTSKGQNAVNDALNSIEQNKISDQSRPNKEVIIRPGVVSEAEFQGKIEISQELIAASEEQFKEFSTNTKSLESYLQSLLKDQDIGEGRIISIVDPSQKVPAQNLIFRVVIENGRYVVQSLPVTVRVERNSTLEGLKLNLKSIN